MRVIGTPERRATRSWPPMATALRPNTLALRSRLTPMKQARKRIRIPGIRPMTLNVASTLIGCDPETTMVRPRATESMPSVTMNEGTRRTAKATPLTRPAATPTSRPAANPAMTPYDSATTAATTPVSATTEPTDRSMLPAMMTSVTPNAGIAMIALC